MTKKIFTLLIILLTISACDEETPYSGYSVFFSYDETYSPFNQASSFGEYITVRRKNNVSYEVIDVFGATHTIQLSEQEARQQFFYGLGGLIIGTPSMGDGNIWAYDWACPNCDMARYRLELNDIGHASCYNCNSKFDLNSGGITIEGKSRRLWRYRVFRDGTKVVIQN